MNANTYTRNRTPAERTQDFEPEFAAFLPGGKAAVITLQENNALAVLDISSATITAVLPLGFKDHSLAANALNPSDQDGGSTELKTYENLNGMHLPNEMAAFEHEGRRYVVSPVFRWLCCCSLGWVHPKRSKEGVLLTPRPGSMAMQHTHTTRQPFCPCPNR